MGDIFRQGLASVLEGLWGLKGCPVLDVLLLTRSEVVTPISVERHDFIVVDSEESGKTEAYSDENSVPQSLQSRDVGV